MSDFEAILAKPWWIGFIIYLIVSTSIRLFLGRRFPQMGKWKLAAICEGIPLTIFLAYLSYLRFAAPSPDRNEFPKARVLWRTEIRQADEPDTWPFKEPRYMLTCVGGHGDYAIILEKVADIPSTSSKARDFLPESYALKGFWKGLKRWETQLLDGQSPDVVKKYVDYSSKLCKEEESRKYGGS